MISIHSVPISNGYDINSDDPEEVSMHLIYSSHSNPKTLENIYRKFGGLDKFTAKNISPSMKNLRNALVNIEHFSDDIHKDIFDNLPKITRSDIYNFANRPYIFKDFAIFEKLWAINKDETINAFSGYWVSFYVESDDFENNQVFEELPMIHAKNCDGDQGNFSDHWSCERRGIFHPDIKLEMEKTIFNDFLKVINPKIITLLQDNILDCNGFSREFYAESSFIKDEHWERLANDPKRNVLNKLAENPFLPTDIAKEIISKHKTPTLREAIARNTSNNELLESIWHSTKSKNIRDIVENNPFFRKL